MIGSTKTQFYRLFHSIINPRYHFSTLLKIWLMILFKPKNLNVFTIDHQNEKTSLLIFVEVVLLIHMERNDLNVCKLMLIEQLHP